MSERFRGGPSPNGFGETVGVVEAVLGHMEETACDVVEETGAPDGRPIETIDVRSAGPPEPLRRTLELLADLADDVVLVQANDRAPQHLYPKLDDRGYAYETVDRAGATFTAVWRGS